MIVADDLIKACSKSDRKAQYKLYEKCYSYLMSICIRYTNSQEDAEELLNMGFLKILNNLDKYKTEVPFGLWIRKVMINSIIDNYRRNKKEKESMEYVDFQAYNEYNPIAVNEYITKTDVEHIYALIRKLPVMSQKVFNLYIIDGYNHKEIAEMLGITEGTSKWHLSFARASLKEKITKATHIIKVLVS